MYYNTDLGSRCVPNVTWDNRPVLVLRFRSGASSKKVASEDFLRNFFSPSADIVWRLPRIAVISPPTGELSFEVQVDKNNSNELV
jgi:hypothetical protein